MFNHTIRPQHNIKPHNNKVISQGKGNDIRILYYNT